jgi:hypothetical protein
VVRGRAQHAQPHQLRHHAEPHAAGPPPIRAPAGRLRRPEEESNPLARSPPPRAAAEKKTRSLAEPGRP